MRIVIDIDPTSLTVGAYIEGVSKPTQYQAMALLDIAGRADVLLRPTIKEPHVLVSLSVRCPFCRDLYVPENGRIPRHVLDTYDGEPICAGSGSIMDRDADPVRPQ